MSVTPPRNNYANPHTPIASAKRPRSSLERNASATRLLPSIKSTPPPPPAPSAAQSPMHPPRPVHRTAQDLPAPDEDDNDENNSSTSPSNSSSSWMGRQVDALFSPVLSFLNHSGSKDDEDNADAERTAVVISDEDATMDEAVPAMAATETTETTADEELTPTKEEPDNEYNIDEIEHDHSYEEEDEEEFNPYLFIKSLPHYNAVQHLRPNTALPPKKKDSPPVSLVLDLDETLVHCTIEPVDDADLIFPVLFHGAQYQVHVRLRPHLFTFLKAIQHKFEVIVFTASQQVYADELLNRIDPDGKFIEHRLFRESCLAVEGNYLKDLNVLGRDLTKTVLVDNSPHAFGYQVDNGIPIESWFDDPDDSELLKLASFLETLTPESNVQELVRSKFQTWKLVQEATA